VAEAVGPVAGLDLVHLQCHFGLETLGWARRGARVTGLDFSRPALDAATALAAELGLPARFVHGDVYDAPALLSERFDIVYTGIGALNWLPDTAACAAVVGALLRPAGALHLVEFHPLADILGEHDLTVAFDTVYARWLFLERGEDGLWRMPEGMPRPPLMYALQARAPGREG
jgi:SAM-dependent methyltransferase